MRSRRATVTYQLPDIERNVHVAHIVSRADNGGLRMKDAGKRQRIGVGCIPLDDGNSLLLTDSRVDGVTGAIDDDDMLAGSQEMAADLHPGFAQATDNGVVFHPARHRRPEIVAYRTDDEPHTRQESADQQNRLSTYLRQCQQKLALWRSGMGGLVLSEQDLQRGDKPANPIAGTLAGLSQSENCQNDDNQRGDDNRQEIAGFEHLGVAWIAAICTHRVTRLFEGRVACR